MRSRSVNITLILLFLACYLPSAAQIDSSIFMFPIQMDEVVVSASRNGFDVQAFIRRVKSDTTFYKAFRSLHLAEFTAVNDIRILDKNGNVTASLKSKTRQLRKHNCRSMQTLEETVTGNFYKRDKSYRYFTAELFAYLFFTKDSVCNENDIVGNNLSVRRKGQMEKVSSQLKQLIFNPGSKIAGVPFMGDKASVFDNDVAKLYDFKLSSVEYRGEECWLFRAVPKKGNEKDVVFNDLSTWFRKSDYAIVARNYALSFNTIFYDFDVQMKVRLTDAKGKLLPAYIEYDGNWHAATQGRERARFFAEFTY